jgi:uncharacterized protein (TIGR00297 family)
MKQVVANGGAAALAAASFMIFDTDLPLYAMIGAFAAASADTWSTEWGRSFGGRPYSLRELAYVSPGDSGAISAVGTVASIAGAASVVLAASMTNLVEWSLVLPLIAAGFLGGVADSIFGAWLQGVWQGESGEKIEHEAGHGGPMLRGVRWMDNDGVNMLATLCGAGLAVVMIT